MSRTDKDSEGKEDRERSGNDKSNVNEYKVVGKQRTQKQ